jgi:lysophospholipase L1-like esterase
LVALATVAVGLSSAISNPARAEDGTILRTITAQSPSCGIGTGIAFDGQQLLVDCWGQNQVWGVSPADGTLMNTYTIGTVSDLGAIAWDRGRGKLWACNLDDQVYLVDLATQTSSFVFTGQGCVDGLAYDGTDDTLWSSEDVAATVQHYTTDGQLIDSKNITGLLGGCGNSGIAVGGSQLLLANNGCSQIYLAPKTLDTSTLFGTYPARLEDLECDDLTFAGAGKAAIWSKDAYDNVLNAFELNPGTCGFGGLPPGPAKTLVAFGDSIAAGEGSGPSNGYPDNPGAYPARLAAKLGWDAKNFAISGACAATAGSGAPNTPASCTKSILADELPLAVSMGLHPDLITITVGANDIQFGRCFEAVIGISKDNPCDKTTLPKSLAALKTNLSQAVAAIKQPYPGVPIAMTKYFNPLPIETQTCGLIPGLYFYKTAVIDNKREEVLRTFMQGKLDSTISDYQNDLVLKALAVIAKLNTTIQEVADGAGATWVPLNFSGHDLCKDYAGSGATAWVFGPVAEVFISYYNKFTGDSREWNFIPLHRCQPTPACDGSRELQISNFQSTQKAGTTFSLSVIFRLNDLPHLTSDGHDAVADLIKDKLQL